MRTIVLPESITPRMERQSSQNLQLGSGPASPLYQFGPQTRIFRAPVTAVGAATCGDREIWGQVLDVSLGGCLLQTNDELTIGEALDLRITIIGDGRRAIADVNGVVRRTSSTNGRAAYGIEFTPADSHARQTLQWLYTQALR